MRVLTFDREGGVEVVVVAPDLALDAASRLRRLTQDALADAGLDMARLTLNGTPLDMPSIMMRGGHDGDIAG